MKIIRVCCSSISAPRSPISALRCDIGTETIDRAMVPKTRKRSTKVSKTKHPKLENEAPKTRKRSTQVSKTEHPKLENEAPKSRIHCTLKDNNFKSCMTQAKPGGGNGCVRTSKGPPIHPTEHLISRLLCRGRAVSIIEPFFPATLLST